MNPLATYGVTLLASMEMPGLVGVEGTVGGRVCKLTLGAWFDVSGGVEKMRP